MSVQPVFGKLCIASNKEEGSIVEDVKGWHGNSDLHICGYFPTHLLYAKNINDAEISVRLSKELDTYENLQEELGSTLEVFATCFGSKQVAMLAALPGLKVPEPTFERSSAIEGDIQLDVSDKSFKRRITLERDTENHKALTTERAEIKIQQASPCSVTVKYSTFTHTCAFPFPIIGDSTRLRVSRTNGWMEVIAPLINSTKHTSIAFPLQKYNSLEVSTWNLPYVNFDRLPKLDLMEMIRKGSDLWKYIHLLSMFTDREFPVRAKRPDLLTSIKNTINAILCPSNWIVHLACEKETISFLLIDEYLDLNSHSVIGEVYVLFNVEVRSRVPAATITIKEEEMRWWHLNLPAMAERCRNYPHLESCEYTTSTGAASPCGCGKGKTVGSSPRLQGWSDQAAAAEATRIVISPIFAVPYLEDTRGLGKYLSEALSNDDLEKQQRFLESMRPITDEVVMQLGRGTCVACYKPSTKKCGRCNLARYCSRECQAEHWKSHKKSCKAVAG